MSYYGTRSSYSHASRRCDPRYHPSIFLQRDTYGFKSARAQTPAKESDSSWACDYCQIATFSSFEEAYKHESTCSMNQNATTGKFSKPQNSLNGPRLLLCMPADKGSLSDRQCYVRSQFVEMFKADESDVSARHSKGAQSLRVGQIGIRCMHCAHLHPKNRAERATCYPSSISRIYQTVADMQRFHFEACTAIPSAMKTIYRSLKTTRPRGQGSPQSYWVASAKELGLDDTNEGIRLSNDEDKKYGHPSSPYTSSSSMSSFSSADGLVSEDKSRSTPLPPLSPESQSSRTTHSQSRTDRTRDEDANMLLALRSGGVLTEITKK